MADVFFAEDQGVPISTLLRSGTSIGNACPQAASMWIDWWRS